MYPFSTVIRIFKQPCQSSHTGKAGDTGGVLLFRTTPLGISFEQRIHSIHSSDLKKPLGGTQ